MNEPTPKIAVTVLEPDDVRAEQLPFDPTQPGGSVRLRVKSDLMVDVYLDDRCHRELVLSVLETVPDRVLDALTVQEGRRRITERWTTA